MCRQETTKNTIITREIKENEAERKDVHKSDQMKSQEKEKKIRCQQ